MHKADYVRQAVAQQEDGHTHHCHWPGCTAIVPPAHWGCMPHWYALPRDLRNRIWAAYRPGQEVSKTPSRAYIEAAEAVQEWIRVRELERAETARAHDHRTPDLFDGA